MKKCAQFRFAQRYYDGELTGQNKALFEKHLKNCPECSAFLSDCENIAGAIKTFADVSADESFLVKLSEKVLIAPKPRLVFSSYFNSISRRFLPAAAALMMLVSSLAFILSRTDVKHEAVSDISKHHKDISIETLRNASLSNGNSIIPSEISVIMGDEGDAAVIFYDVLSGGNL